MRLLAVDFGFSQIGIAVGESEPFVCSTRPSLQASGALKKDAAALDALAAKEEAELILVGVPVNEGEDRMARICKQLAGHLEDLGRKVVMVDESFTSVQADAALRSHGVFGDKRKELIHGESAVQILERYVNGQPPL
jgi:putative Holliday junction resolvase